MGAQQLEKLVSEANDGVPIRPLFPGNIHLTDNSGVYFVSADNGDAGCEWRIAHLDGIDTSVRSKYHKTPQTMLLGQRARLTWSAFADGTVATPYITFLGLNEWELPTTKCPSGILMIPIEGLDVGGVNPDCKSMG